MANVEILSALAAGTVRLSGGSRSSSKDQLGKADLAGLLAGLTGPEMCYAIVKYAGDASVGDELRLSVRNHARSLASRHAWKISKNQVDALADLATSEDLNPCRCNRCGGIGNRLSRVCAACNGTGIKHLSGRAMANAVGIDETAFRKPWKERLSAVMAYLYELDRHVRAAVARNSN
jgi:hypothetical protein